jgi:hypothetical protein
METVKMPTGKWEIVRIGKMGDAIRRIRLPHPPYDSEAEANEAAREEKEKDPDAEYITVEVSEDIVPGKSASRRVTVMRLHPSRAPIAIRRLQLIVGRLGRPSNAH